LRQKRAELLHRVLREGGMLTLPVDYGVLKWYGLNKSEADRAIQDLLDCDRVRVDVTKSGLMLWLFGTEGARG
jgi:hypothetical protein